MSKTQSHQSHLAVHVNQAPGAQESRSKADPPAVTRAVARALGSGFRPVGRMCSERQAEWTPGCPKDPWLGLPCTSGHSDTKAWAPAWSSAQGPARLLSWRLQLCQQNTSEGRVLLDAYSG